MMLRIERLNVFYGDVQVLFDVSLELKRHEIVTIIGSNGAGKSTLLKTISGILRPTSGSIEFLGERLHSLSPVDIVRKGIYQIVEGRGLFPSMSTYENLLLGSFCIKDKRKRASLMEEVFEAMPVLKERQSQLAGSLSGGEQQLLAVGRGLMSEPKLLMLDEPTLGLAPKLIPEIFKLIKMLRQKGTTILLVEQNVRESLQEADRGYVLREGKIVLSNNAESLLKSRELRRAYLGA
jgi:branched-chain amino acid transport system ATP-binding protein